MLKREYADDRCSAPGSRPRPGNAASLHHPNIATVFDFGENDTDDGRTRPYLVMELVDGRPLSDAARAAAGRWTPSGCATWSAQAAEALGAGPRGRARAPRREARPTCWSPRPGR